MFYPGEYYGVVDDELLREAISNGEYIEAIYEQVAQEIIERELCQDTQEAGKR